jgi:hypothetical protein
MLSFQALVNDAAQHCLEHLGEPVLINGIDHTAIFNDEAFVDETGRYRQTTLTIEKSKAANISVGHAVVARGRSFTINHKPDIEDPLIELELKNA